MSDTRQARIDAGAQAVCDLFAQHKEKPAGERGRNIPAVAYAEAVLAAADAVAAPAVGVTAAEAMKEYALAYRRYWDAQERWFDNGRYGEGVPKLDRLLAELQEKEHALRALLTASSEGGRGSLDAFQAEVGAWGERTFPKATDFSMTNHLREEVVELQLAVYNVWSQIHGTVNVAEEAADCLMMLLHLAHRNGFSLIEEARKKFAVNQTRTWTTVTAGGYVKHDEGGGEAGEEG